MNLFFNLINKKRIIYNLQINKFYFNSKYFTKMKYKKVINYLWKHRVQIEFIENNLLETFFFVLVCFLLYKLATKFFKIDNKKKKLFDSFFTIIFFILILSIFITQAIILELNQRKFSQLEYEIRIKNRKIKELKKKLNKWYDWMKNHKN
jgi:uncharacterized membrane protein